jgi:chromate reductase
MTKVAVFVGSLQKNSVNKKLAKVLETLSPEGVEFEYININMPLFNQDLEANLPAEVQTAKDAVEAADGVLFVTPEYNRSIPGVLKNAIDWTSRPWGSNSFAGKPVGIVGASLAPTGTAIAQSDLRHIVSFLSMKMLGQPEVYVGNAGELFNESGELIDERWNKNLKSYADTFANWIESEK